jgi:rod shape-determining protein MreC
MNFKRYRDFVIVLLALAVPFWFLRASMRDPRQISGPDRVIMRIAAPIQYASATLARGLSNLWGDYIYLVDVKEQNAELSSKLARAEERARQLEQHQVENRRLQRLLDLRESVKADVVSAQVIGKTTNDFFRVGRVTLDRAARDIGPNLPVLSADGVVGTTLKSAGDSVDVRLVVDAGSGVDVVVQRTGARGFVRGTGDETKYACNVEYMQRTDEVEVGDLLVTSGVGRRFPRGIPVAKVTAVTRRDFGIYQNVTATPTVDFSRIEEVLIVISPPGDEPQAARDAPGASPQSPRK